MKRNEYSASSVSNALWFMEFRKMVQLLSQGKSIDEIKKLNKEENIFGISTPERANRLINTVAIRIQSLDNSFIPIFLDSDVATQKLFALVASFVQDTLFFDFVYEVVREKMIIGTSTLTEADIRIFFKNKQAQDENVASWTDQTIQRLGRGYKNQLLDAGILDGNIRATERMIYKPILDPVFKHWLEDFGYDQIVKALEGTR